jgi:hypothetical protein
MDQWYLGIYGELTPDVRRAVEAAPDMDPSGGSHTAGSGRTHGLQVQADTVDAAMARAREVLAELPVTVTPPP